MATSVIIQASRARVMELSRPDLIASPLAGFVLVLCAALWAGAGDATAQECQQFSGVFFDDAAGDCRSMPASDRSFYPGLIRWNGGHYLYQSTGNDMQFLSLTNPSDPNDYSNSSWHGAIGNQGDNNWGLEAIALCDDCRWGVVFYRLATVFFDLGTGAAPSVDQATVASDLPGLPYGFTFKHGNTQFLIAQGIGPSPCSDAGLYIFEGTNPATMTPIQCLSATSGNEVDAKINGGKYLQDASLNGGTPYLWTTSGYYVAAWEVNGSGTGTRVNYAGRIPGMTAFGRSSNTLGFDVDLDHRVAVSADRFAFKTWTVNDLSAPVQAASVADHMDGNIVALKHPIAYSALYSGLNSGMTWDVSSPSNPTKLDEGFWSTDKAWNQHECDLREDGAVFGPNGNHLYVARHVVSHAFDVSACTGPSPPNAVLTLERRNDSGQWVPVGLGGDVFPGDEVRVSSNSTGDDITSTEIWITDSDGTTVAQSSGTSSATPVVFTIPLETPDSSYTARVRVENSVGSDQTNASVPLDRRPLATIEYTPIAPLTGEDLSLTGSGQGTPQLPVGSELPDPFEWLITPPSGEPYALVGETPHDVTLDTPGSWTFGLTVHYAHDNPSGGGPYDATKQVMLDISSVSAALSVSPATPVNTGNVTLDARASRMAGTVTSPTWAYEFSASGSGAWGPLALCSNSDLCTIPGDDDNPFFSPGQYDFRVTLSDSDTQENSTSEVLGVTIADGAINVDLTISDATPDIGQVVSFTVTGAPSVDSVTWNFGGPGCTGYTQSYTCTPIPGVTCMSWTYAYATSGTKTVTMTATIDGQVQSPVSEPVTVNSSGSCGGGCSYAVSPTSRTFDHQAGSGTFTVNTGAECAWAPQPSTGWINILSGGGPGSGTVSYEVTPNSDPNSRTGAIVVQGQNHSIGQYGTAGMEIECDPGPDDGQAETLIGWGSGDSFVQRMGPGSLPASLRRVCFEVTRNGIDDQMSGWVVVYDDDGPGGSPGTLLESVPVVVQGVAVWPETSLVSVALGADSVEVNGGAVFVGIEWDDEVDRPFYAAVDESIGTPQQIMAYRADTADPWSDVTAAVPGARALLIRGDFVPLSDGEWMNVAGRVNAEGSFGAWSSDAVTAVFDDPGGNLCGAAESGLNGLEIHCQASDGSWAMQSHAGLSPGQTNDRILTSRWFDDCLYLGTGDDQSFSTAGAEIWRWCDGASPERVVEDGFGFSAGYSKNAAVLDLESFGGDLIASTRGEDAGTILGVEAYSSTIGDSWQLIWNRSLGDDADLALPSMTVSDGSLYLGVEANPCRVHRTPDAIAWFGDSMDCFGTAGAGIPRLESWNGAVFAALEGTNQLFFRAAAMDWRPIAAPADLLAVDLIATIDGELYLAGGTADGAVIWQRSGTSWIATNTPGFGDPNNTGIATLDFTSHGIAAGTRNTATGGEVWLTPLPFFADGFESGDVSAWSN
jgi:hypothetical protein